MKLYKTLSIILFNVFDTISATNEKTNQKSMTKYEINSMISLDNLFLNFSLIDYGNWCGPSHGGYQDCCNQGPCKSCKIEDGKPTKECLEECQPIDKLDYYCAIHDQCCLYSDSQINQEHKHIDCYPEGNHCYCDCSLVKQSSTLLKNGCNSFMCEYYLTAVKYVFENVVSCWYINSENIEMCNKNNQNITNYCNDDNENN